MTREEFEYRYVRWVVAALCAYEVVAIVTGRLPTWSRCVRWARASPPGELVYRLGLRWLDVHTEPLRQAMEVVRGWDTTPDGGASV